VRECGCRHQYIVYTIPLVEFTSIHAALQCQGRSPGRANPSHRTCLHLSALWCTLTSPQVGCHGDRSGATQRDKGHKQNVKRKSKYNRPTKDPKYSDMHTELKTDSLHFDGCSSGRDLCTFVW